MNIEEAAAIVRPINSNIAYDEGFRNGWLDWGIGVKLKPAQVSMREGYATGYFDGMAAHQRGKPLK